MLQNLRHYVGRVLSGERTLRSDRRATCYPNVAALPEVPDCAVITAAREAVEEIVLDCVKAGVGGAIIFASGYAEIGKRGPHRAARPPGRDRARETGLRIVGPNCIGVVNAALDSRITFMNITPIPPPRRQSIGMISQSGALGMALAQAWCAACRSAM